MLGYPKPTRVRLSQSHLKVLKQMKWKQAGGLCEECGEWVPLLDNGVFDVFTCAHLAHIRSRGAGGSDTPENTRILCPKCHMGEHGPQWSNRR